MLVYIAQSLGGKSGAARLSGDVLSALVATGRPVTVVTRAAGRPGPADGARSLRAPRDVPFPHSIEALPRRLARWGLAAAGDLPRRWQLRRLRPALVLVHSLEEDELFRRQTWAHTGRAALIVHESPRHFAGTEARHDLAWALTTMRSYSDLVFVSQRCRDEWLSFPELAGKRSIHIPNCAREDEVREVSRRDRCEVRASLGLPADRFVAVTVGTLQPRKGQDIVVGALDELRSAVPALDLFFVGAAVPATRWSRGSLAWADELRCEVARLGHDGHVHFMGARDDALAWIYASDVLVLPSRAEAQPLTVLEAMALGTPVVASNVDGVRELVVDGVSGELFDPERPSGLVEAVARLAGDPERRRAMAGRAAERYDSEFNAALFRERYRRAVEEILSSEPAATDERQRERRVVSAMAIRASGLSKRYALGERRPAFDTLRDVIAERFAALGTRRRRPDSPTGGGAETFWALRDLSFEIARGEVVGVIGRNGAGKTTLLKILSRITEPTEGWAEIHGRVGCLLEVGSGFHLELSGRENVFLNGAILGMRRLEIARKFDEILAFAELEKFVDTAVKHYSSGMYMRLAFAVAAHLETEILLVDEVLAVGDAAFQKKCLGKIEQVAGEGRTVLFVSHNMAAVTGLCGRALWIDGGRLRADGPVDEVAVAYLAALSSSEFHFVSPEKGLTIRHAILQDASGRRTAAFAPGDDLVVEIDYEVEGRIAAPYVMIVVQSVHGTCFAANMLLDGSRPAALEGRGSFACRFASLPLLPQAYTVRIGIRASDGREWIVPMQEAASFTVTGGPEDYGFSGEHFHGVVSRSTPVVVPYEWRLPDGSRQAVALRRSPALIHG